VVIQHQRGVAPIAAYIATLFPFGFIFAAPNEPLFARWPRDVRDQWRSCTKDSVLQRPAALRSARRRNRALYA